jgi:1,4-dihydroxy-2-naphthoyl-CoA synthase
MCRILPFLKVTYWPTKMALLKAQKKHKYGAEYGSFRLAANLIHSAALEVYFVCKRYYSILEKSFT